MMLGSQAALLRRELHFHGYKSVVTSEDDRTDFTLSLKSASAGGDNFKEHLPGRRLQIHIHKNFLKFSIYHGGKSLAVESASFQIVPYLIGGGAFRSGSKVHLQSIADSKNEKADDMLCLYFHIKNDCTKPTRSWRTQLKMMLTQQSDCMQSLFPARPRTTGKRIPSPSQKTKRMPEIIVFD